MMTTCSLYRSVGEGPGTHVAMYVTGVVP
ncbi:hypothetical protein GA0115255_107142, partial [Streptomyces sp. Ncost-T6T-2b]